MNELLLQSPRRSTLRRTLGIAVIGLGLPLFWPGVLPHLFDLSPTPMPGMPDAPTALTTLEIGADALTGVAYTVIASLLAYVVYRHRTRLPFDWVVLAFGLFIVACGLTHVMHVVTRFLPVLWLDGYLRAITAVVSVATAAVIPAVLPRLTQLIDADDRAAHQQSALEHTNQQLQEALRDTEVLFTLSSGLERARSVDEVVREAHALLAGATKVDSVLLWIIQGDHGTVTHQHGTINLRGTALFTQGMRRPRGSMWTALDHRAAQYIDDAATFPGVLHERRSLGVHTLAHLPLHTAGATYVLSCLRHARTPWTAREQRLLEVGALSITLALERQHHAQQLEAAARTDPLTGLGNRRAFDEALVTAVHSSDRQQVPLTVLSLDLDDLKRVNDQEGHGRGDLYLKGFASCMRAALRREDQLFRVGGDEFVALLPRTGPAGFQGVSRRVREAVAELRALGFERADVSVGLAAYPTEAPTLTRLVQLSDERLSGDKRDHQDRRRVETP